MDDVAKLIGLALGLLALATAVGFGLQRGRISELQGRLNDNDDELARKDRRLVETTAELEKVKTDLAALTRVVTGEAHWVAIGEKLDEHHDLAEEHWDKDEKLLQQIVDRLDRLPRAS